jgi:hypothetical protein
VKSRFTGNAAAVIQSRVALAGLALSVLAGCSDNGRAAAADDVATRMLRAASGSDGTTACELLAPRTAAEVADSQSCPDAIVQEHLPAPGRMRSTEVFGQWAQVRMDGDTVFLAVFPGGWRVVAAGCTPRRSDEPYDCAVQGS